MKKAIYAGSFDPFTNGHHSIAERALNIFDELHIIIAVSPSKHGLLSFEQRKEVISEIWKDESRVKVITYDKLLVQYAQEHGIQFLVRGLRPTGDFDSEFLMASMNRKLFSECDTVFLAASFKSVAPIFSTGSNKTIEFATVTPSLVIIGLPLSSSSNTPLPLAPKVELTACVSLSIPLNT